MSAPLLIIWILSILYRSIKLDKPTSGRRSGGHLSQLFKIGIVQNDDLYKMRGDIKIIPEEAIQRIRAIASTLHNKNADSINNIQLHLVLVSNSDLIWGPILLTPNEFGHHQHTARTPDSIEFSFLEQ